MGDIDPIPTLFRIVAGVALVVLLVPVGIVVLAGLNSGDYLTFPPEGLSLRWVRTFLTSPTFMPAFLFSFGLALAASLIATVVGTMAAVFLTRTRWRGRELLRGLFILPVVLPGVVLGLALYVFFIWTGSELARTFPGLLVGHLLVTIPFVVATVSAALVDVDPALEEAARSLGAGPLEAFRKVTFPIVAPGVSAGFIFAFIISFGQFELTLFLSPVDRQPLPLAIYTSLRYAFEPTAAAAGIFAICLVVLSTLLSARLLNLRKLLARR
jgi:putative spermidine/putrescine transport system permease protein